MAQVEEVYLLSSLSIARLRALQYSRVCAQIPRWIARLRDYSARVLFQEAHVKSFAAIRFGAYC